MKRVLLGLALLGLAVGANADPTDLCGGALIAHYVAELELSENPPEGMCAAYAPHAITSAAEQVNTVTVGGPYQLADWFIIAAWTEDKEFCGVQFGFSDYDPGIFAYSDFGACFPATGGLEIPSTNWPGPDEGIAFVVTGDAWNGNYVPVYWFIGYAYPYDGVIELVPDPTVAQPFGGTGNCASPPEKWDAYLGGLGINMGGIYVEPTPCDEIWACCVGTDCSMQTAADCEGMNGTWLEGVECEPINPCDPAWACCVFGECIEATESQCESAGGEWFEGEHCENVNCPPYAACCIGPDLHECIMAFEEECAALNGVFYPDMTCEPIPCEGSPTDETSWGTIKSMYR